MKKPVDIDKFHTDARSHDDRIKDTARKFAQALVYESESGRRGMTVDELRDAVDNNREARREPSSRTEEVAQEAIDDYENVRGEIEAPEDRDNLDQVRHQSEPTTRGALNALHRELRRDYNFDNNEPDSGDVDGEGLLDVIVAAMKARRAGRQ